MLLVGNQGQTGKALGQNITAGMGEFSDILLTQLQARYYQQAYRGQIFFGANTAAQALSVASGTFTGLAVANPTGSQKNLVLLQIGVALDSASTGVGTVVLGYAATVALTTGSSTGGTGTSTILGSSVGSAAKVGASCTFGAAPTIILPLIGVTATTVVSAVPHFIDVAGSIIVPPGQALAIEATGTAISIIGSMMWAEVAL